jgi:hypothetical protein
MTVSSTVSKSGPYAGAGTTGPFTVGFRFLDNSHLRVVRTDSNGANTDLVLDTDYTVLGAGAESGAVTLTTNLTDGQQLTIVRAVPATQEADYVQNDAFPAESHETALDKLTMLVQQNAEAISRSVKVRVSDSPLGELPAPSARANTTIGFDATGNLVVKPDPSSLGAGDLIPYTLVSGVDFNPGDTSVTLPRAPGSKGNLQVNFDANGQEFSEWNVSGVTVTFASPIPVFVEKIWGYIGTTLSTEVPPGDSVGDDQLTWGNVLNRLADSVAELKTLSSSRYTRGFVTGYYTPGDGGGGHYYYDASDTTSADNGGTIIVANDGARWKLVYTDSVSVRQFGAKGDGVTDDTAAFQRAIDAMVGAKLIIPRGNPLNSLPFYDHSYIISAPLTLSSTSGGHYIRGDGWRWDVNWGAVGGALVKNINATGGHAFDITAGKNGLNVLEDFGILGNNGSGSGIRGTDLYNTHIDKMLVTGHGAHGIHFIKSFNSHIYRCLVGNVRQHGIYWNGLANGVSTRDTVMFGPNGINGGFACMQVDGVGGNSLECLIDGCTFEPNLAANTTFGLIVKNTNGLTLKGNYFELFPNTGRVFYGDITLQGFDVQGNYFQDGVVEFAQSTFGTIDNNVFYRDTIATTLVVSPPLSGANNVRVGRGNIFLNGATNGAPAARGVAVLTAGSVVIPNANANTGLPPMLSRTLAGGTLGHLLVGTILNGTSFQVVSSDAGDTSTIQWEFPGY